MIFKKGDLVRWKGDDHLFGIVLGKHEDPRFVNVAWLVGDLLLEKASPLGEGLLIVEGGTNNDPAATSND